MHACFEHAQASDGETSLKHLTHLHQSIGSIAKDTVVFSKIHVKYSKIHVKYNNRCDLWNKTL